MYPNGGSDDVGRTYDDGGVAVAVDGPNSRPRTACNSSTPVATPGASSSSSSADAKEKKKQQGGGGVNVEGTTWRIDPARRRARTERAARAAEAERWKAGESDGRFGGDGTAAADAAGGRQAGYYNDGAREAGGGVADDGNDDERGFRDEMPPSPFPDGGVGAALGPRVTMDAPNSVGWENKMRGTAAAGLYNAGRRSEEAMSNLGSAAASASSSSNLPPPSSVGGYSRPSDDGACLHPPPGVASSSSEPSHGFGGYAGSSQYSGSHPATTASRSELTGSAASTWVHDPGTRDSSNAAVVDGVRQPVDDRSGTGGDSGGGGSLGLQLPTYVSRSSLQQGGAGSGAGESAAQQSNGRPSMTVDMGRGPAAPTPLASSRVVEAPAEFVHPGVDGGNGSATPQRWYQKRRNRMAMLLVALVVAAGGITAGVLLSGKNGGNGTTSSADGTDNGGADDKEGSGEQIDSEGSGETTPPPKEDDDDGAPTIDLTPPTNAQMAAAEEDLVALVCDAFPPSCLLLRGEGSAFSTQHRAAKWVASHPPALLTEAYASDYAKLARYSLATLYLSTTFRDDAGGDDEEQDGGDDGDSAWMTYADVCDWTRVQCDDGGIVEVLDLGWFIKAGTVPDDLAFLRDGLKELYLQNNGLGGTLPVSLSQLSNLEVLAVGENKLTGSIPPEYGQLSSLQTLKVHANQFEGSVPADVCALTGTGGLQTLWADCAGKNGGKLKCDCCTFCCDGQLECCPPQQASEVKQNCVRLNA